MPACGQAVGCSVCDTPELRRGAAGLCARVRACADAAESLHTYIYIHTKVPGAPLDKTYFIVVILMRHHVPGYLPSSP